MPHIHLNAVSMLFLHTCRRGSDGGSLPRQHTTKTFALNPRTGASKGACGSRMDKNQGYDFQRAGTFDEMSIADFQELWTRLCENDVEYNEMKVSY